MVNCLFLFGSLSPSILLTFGALLGWTFGCAHWSQKPKDGPITLTATATDEPKVLEEFKAGVGLAPYQGQAKTGGSISGQAEWMSCVGKASRGTVVMMHDRTAFEPDTFCADWPAQAFLSKGFAVVGINRPGFGRSTGSQDLVGPGSLAASLAAIKAAQGEGRLPTLVGAFGYGLGGTAAALFSKRLSGLKFLLLGGGIYDFEETLRVTSDGDLKKQIAAMRQDGGDQAIEERSVGYDVGGLPRKVGIYHGKLDTTVPPGQAKAFSDSLESSGEYGVTLQMIEGLPHDIPAQHHRNIIEVLLVSVGTVH